MNNLVIVESPTKARTLSRFLGSDYRIEASFGHIRDLPKSDMGVDLETFDPQYIIPRDKKKRVNELAKLAQEAKTIYLASDPDREGEAIAWHLKYIIEHGANGKLKAKKGDVPKIIKRVEFHEITESAIKESFDHPKEINQPLVDAQQARRVLDRVVGYKLSPVLWKKVKSGLSAGRVQTVALKLVVEREREILAFNPVEYWSIEAELETTPLSSSLPKGERIIQKQSEIIPSPLEAQSSSGASRGQGEGDVRGKKFFAALTQKNGTKIEVHKKEEADEIVTDLEKATYSVAKVVKKQVKRNPPPPFTTSTLQQAAGNKLGFSAKKTMMVAQNLYERGFITYMRTDSTNLSTQALGAAREYIEKKIGKEYLPEQARVFKGKSKGAQEAHEAVRPTDMDMDGDSLNIEGFTRDHSRLYDLIWKRMMASQMKEALVDQTSVDVIAETNGNTPIPVILATEGRPESWDSKTQDSGQAGMTMIGNVNYTLRATGSILVFAGWLKLYGAQIVAEDEDQKKEEEEEGKSKKQVLPDLTESDPLNMLKLLPEQHFTEPPPRYTESSLVKKMEELGIGRPSTYAPTLSTIQDRFYVEKEDKKFKPTSLGTTVTDFLVKYFPDVFDYGFTASMEDRLDEIEEGKREWQQTIKDFYIPFSKKLESTQETAEHVKLEVETVDKECPKCGKQLVVRQGKFGKFLACSGFPDCKHTEPFDQISDVKCPKDGGDVVQRRTKTGRPFWGCKNYPNCDYATWNKPVPPVEDLEAKTVEVKTEETSE